MSHEIAVRGRPARTIAAADAPRAGGEIRIDPPHSFVTAPANGGDSPPAVPTDEITDADAIALPEALPVAADAAEEMATQARQIAAFLQERQEELAAGDAALEAKQQFLALATKEAEE